MIAHSKSAQPRSFMIPMDSWHTVIDALPVPAAEVFLAAILKTRRRGVPIGINGVVQYVSRAQVRDYLREKLLVATQGGAT